MQGTSPGLCRGSGPLSGAAVVAAAPLVLPNTSALALMLKFRFNFQNLIRSLPSALNNISCLRRDGAMGECSDG